jgi:hypothetical protein
MGILDGFENRGGILIPKKGHVGGKSEGLIRAIDLVERFGYRLPSSILLPAEFLDDIVSAIPPSEIMKDDQKSIWLLRKRAGNVLRDYATLIADLFPERVAIRSSDLNEDSFRHRLPGFYTSQLVCRTENEDFIERISSAIFGICIDYLNPDKVAFRLRNKMSNGLGLLVQELVGRVQGDPLVNKMLGVEKFYPDLAGYLNAAFPDKITVDLCKGFGSLLVEGKPHYMLEYSRSTGKIVRISDYQEEALFFENGLQRSAHIDRQVELTDEFVRALVENALGFERELGFPEGQGLDFEFAIPSMEDGIVYNLQNSPMPIKRGTVWIEEPQSPMIKPESYIGVGSKVFRDFAALPMPRTGSESEKLGFLKALARYNETHTDYLLFILPIHILTQGSGVGEYYRFGDTYNAGGVVEVHDTSSSHSPADGAVHFANYVRSIDQLFLSGEPTEHYQAIQKVLHSQLLDSGRSSIVAGKGEIYLAVDENKKAGALDLRRIDDIGLFEG